MEPIRPRPHELRVLRGVAFVVVATVFFAVMNSAVKHLRHSLPTVELIWARPLVHLLFVAALFAPRRGGWQLFATRRPVLQVSRSLRLLWGPASIVAPFHYVQLVGAAVLGYWRSATCPRRGPGSAPPLIVASGLFLARREGVGGCA